LKLYDDFPELLQPINSLPISRQWDRPIEITGPMKRQRLNIFSSAERAQLNRQLKDAMEASLIRPMHCEIGWPILLCVRLLARYDCALTNVDLTKLRV
jgi:hypothetical protein